MEIMTLVEMEAQRFELPDEIAKSDELIRKALAPYFPFVANATITRTEGQPIKIVKRAGTKGATPKEVLAAAPEEINPAIAMLWELQSSPLEPSPLELSTLIGKQEAIAIAIIEGEKAALMVKRSLKFLKRCKPIPSSSLVPGF